MIGFSLGLPLLAQDDEPVYARIAEWDIKREHWGDYVELYEKYQLPVLQKLLANGTIVEFGLAEELLHSPEGYTHSAWWSAKSYKGLETVIEEFQKASSGSPMAAFSDAIVKHRDSLMRGLCFESRPATLDSGYLFTRTIQVKEGKGSEFYETWEKYTKPVFENLVSDGVVVAFGLDRESLHTEDPLIRTTWYAVASLDDDEKVDAAFEAAGANRSEEERMAIRNAWGDVANWRSHRDGMSRIIHYGVK